MGDILRFPSAQAQGLAYLDRQLRELLLRKGADDTLVNFAVQQLTDTYTQLSESEQYSFDVEIPNGLSSEESQALSDQINIGLEGVRRQNHSLLINLVAQLVLAEVKLFQHEREP